MSARHTQKERLMLYRAGWKSGAGPGVKAPKKEGDADYEAGYADGLAARVAADKAALERFEISAEEARSWVLRTTAGAAEEHGTGGEYGDGSAGDCPANTEAPTNPGLNPEEYRAHLQRLEARSELPRCELCGLAGVLDTAECPAAWTHGWERAPDGTRLPPQHGHVRPLASGAVARCGGPALCAVCAAEEAYVEGGAMGLRAHVEETVRLKASLVRKGGFTPRDPNAGPGRVGPARFEEPLKR